MSRQKTEIDLNKMEELAQAGLSVLEIAANLNIGRSTFYEKAKSNPDILDTIRRGRASLVKECIGIMLGAARAGDWKAAAALLQRYGDAFTGSLAEEERDIKIGISLW